MKRFFNLSTIIGTTALVAGIVIFFWQANYAAAIMTALALSCACTARRSELMAADGISALAEFKEKYRILKSDYLNLAKQNEATSHENAQLHERIDDLTKQHNDTVAKSETAKPQSRKRARSKRPIQDIKESLKEISPKKEAE